jgi:hypothetical protein
MAGLNNDAQWIVMMGFVVSLSFFFLAMLLNQSTLVGQTTAESVLEFSKNDIRDVRSVIIQSDSVPDPGIVQNDITNISISRKDAVVYYYVTMPAQTGSYTNIFIHYNNGVTAYNETWISSYE